MKRIFALLLALVLLAGCAGHPLAPEAALTGQTLELEARQLLDTPEGLLACGAEKWLLLSREDLSILAEYVPDAGALAYVQLLEGGISIADPEKGTITLLSPGLSVIETIPCTAGGNTWVVRRDGTEVYALTAQGIRAWSRADGSSRELLSCRYLSVLGTGAGSLILGAVGAQDILNHWYELDLNTGMLTELTGSGLLAWQAGLQRQQDGTYLLPLEGELQWYGSDGSFLSACPLPGQLTTGRDFVWDSARQGWFFLGYDRDGCRVMFWKPVPGAGESVDLTGEQIPEGELLPRELYDRAAEMSDRFGLDIRIAERAPRSYKAYDSGMLTDPELTARALDVLEQALAVYPAGFFRQLRYGNRATVRIELVDWLRGKDGKDVSSGTSAFTLRLDRCCVIVLSAQRIRESAIFHEFSHIIDDRMAFEARLREGALYSEEGWLALQPEGFRYADSYQSIPEEVTKFYDSGYFARNYACVSATEDRAVTMEKAMMGERAVFEDNPHLMPKLQYYCACIRDSFDTTGWPAVLPWEVLLQP